MIPFFCLKFFETITQIIYLTEDQYDVPILSKFKERIQVLNQRLSENYQYSNKR
jgi:hypothetical protein